MVCPGLHMLVDSLAQGVRTSPSKRFVDETIAEIVYVIFAQPHAQPIVAVIRQTVINFGNRPCQFPCLIRVGFQDDFLFYAK